MTEKSVGGNDLLTKMGDASKVFAEAEKVRADADKVRAETDKVRSETEADKQLAQNKLDVAAEDLEASASPTPPPERRPTPHASTNWSPSFRARCPTSRPWVKAP